MNTTETSTPTNINTLSLSQKAELMQSIYQSNSYFNELYHCDHLELETPNESTELRNAITHFLTQKNQLPLGVPLENMHNYLSDEMRAYNFSDGVNKISTLLYEPDETIKNAYLQLIKKLRESLLDEPFYFQETPTIRIHCPNSLHSNHYPRYHSDISYGHPPEEINIWLPLTEIIDNHGFKMICIKESNHLLKKYNYDFSTFIHDAIHLQELTDSCEKYAFDVKTPFKKLFAFDSRCIHSGEPLKTHTRVSLDIRILPVSKYKEMKIEYQGSGRRKILFSPGHCYHSLDSDQLFNSKEQ